MKAKRFWDDQFKVDVQFVGACGPKELTQFVHDKYKVEIGDPEALDGCIDLLDRKTKDGGKERCYLVWVRKEDGFYTLLHECLHLAKHILVDRSMPFNETNDELIAYLQEYWFRRMWRVLGRKEGEKE